MNMPAPVPRPDHASSGTKASEPDAATLQAMRLLAHRPDLTQRELSREMGLSLGKTHYVLRALLDKGFLKIQNFRRSDSKLAYAYLLTPNGAAEKVRLTRAFLDRKEAEFERLQATIALLRQEVREAQASETRQPDHTSDGHE